MKALCLATAMTIVLLLSVTVSFRLAPRNHRERLSSILYLACTVALVGSSLASPPVLAFIRPCRLSDPPLFALLLVLFFFAAAFFGGVLQLYNLADRGFSLRLLIGAQEETSGT